MVFKNADTILKELGYTKVEENKYMVVYHKYNEKFKYNERLDIVHKHSGRHIVQCYEEKRGIGDYVIMVGIDQPTMKACLKKMREKGWKYGKR